MEPSDLNALRRQRKARQSAAKAEPYRFVFGDPPEEFTIPPEADWPAIAGPPLNEGDLPTAFAILLGADQWSRLLVHGPELGDLIDLEAWLSAQQGIKNLGEEPAPNGSSPPTAQPSKPTSNDSTGSTSPKRSPKDQAG
jgi:hypothetical protein